MFYFLNTFWRIVQIFSQKLLTVYKVVSVCTLCVKQGSYFLNRYSWVKKNQRLKGNIVLGNRKIRGEGKDNCTSQEMTDLTTSKKLGNSFTQKTQCYKTQCYKTQCYKTQCYKTQLPVKKSRSFGVFFHGGSEQIEHILLNLPRHLNSLSWFWVGLNSLRVL